MQKLCGRGAMIQDLDKKKPIAPDKEEWLVLHSACHPESPTWARINDAGGIVMECAQCGKDIVRLVLETR